MIGEIRLFSTKSVIPYGWYLFNGEIHKIESRTGSIMMSFDKRFLSDFNIKVIGDEIVMPIDNSVGDVIFGIYLGV